jgi:2-keto-3-deoxy-6-phosphogluconate aldolase
VKNEFILPQREPEARVLRGGVLKLMSIPKNEVLGKILASGLVAVIGAENPDQAARIAEACALGGVAALEITFTVPNAGAVAVGVAGNLTAGAKTGGFASITQLARQFVETVTQARGQ